MKPKQTRFHEEWFRVYSYPMPPHIERLPISDIQAAIEFGRQKYQPVCEGSGNDDSMRFEDNHNNLT